MPLRRLFAGQLQRVIVPNEQDPADGDWQTPFMMQVSPVTSVSQAYLALTETRAQMPVSAMRAEMG